MTTANDALRAELITMLSDDVAAVGAVYATADQHRAVFATACIRTTTPWPYAIFEWTPADQAPPEVRRALRVVRMVEDRLPMYAVLSTAYTVVEGVEILIGGLDVGEIDRRRFEIGLPPVAGDLAARAAGRPIGPGAWEPWPQMKGTNP